MRTPRAVLALVTIVASTTLACPKKDDGGDKKSEPKTESTTSKTEDKQPDDPKKDTPKATKSHPNKDKKKPATAKKKATKDKKDGPVPKKTDKKTEIVGADDEFHFKKKFDQAPKGACDDIGDGVATCDGDNLYFCLGGDLYQVDCDAVAKSESYTDGACFETDVEVDCLGCDVGADGAVVCCDGNDKYCCDGDGFCWDDTTLTPPVQQDDEEDQPATPSTAKIADDAPKYDPGKEPGTFACDCDIANGTSYCEPSNWGDQAGACEKKYAPDCTKVLKCAAGDGEFPSK